MNNAERNRKLPPRWTGVIAIGRSLPRARLSGGGKASGAPAAGPRRRLILACLPVLALTLGLAVSATPAFAEPETKGPPQLTLDLRGLRPTRITLIASIFPHGSVTSWSVEVATTPSGGTWTVLASGTSSREKEIEVYQVFRHLAPSTTYYLRAVGKNEFGTTTVTNFIDHIVEPRGDVKEEHFTTLPVGAPELFGEDQTFEEEQATSDSPSPENIACVEQQTVASCAAPIWANGAETEYHFEYATSEGGPYSPVTSGAGTVSAAEEFAEPKAKLTGLSPEKTYYLRLDASNKEGAISIIDHFETTLARPRVDQVGVRNVTGTSAHVDGSFRPDNFETKYRLEYTVEPKSSGSWVAVPGGSGTIPAGEATEEYRRVSVELTGLKAATTYYVRLFAENQYGEGEVCTGRIGSVCEPSTTAADAMASFETFGPPAAYTLPVHTFHGEEVRVLGAVDPNGVAINEEQAITFGGGAAGGTFTLTFEGETTAPIPFEPEVDEAERISHALQALPRVGAENINVSEDFLSQTYTVEFKGPLAGRALPQITADATGLAPSGTIAVATVMNGAPFDAHYHFEYTTSGFADCGTPANPTCLVTPEVVLQGRLQDGAVETSFVGADLPGLHPGGSYHYRMVASNSSPGAPIVDGAEQTFTVPAPAPEEGEASCSNQALRTGPSAHLPDCRAYEQVTPVEKGATQDVFKYGSQGEEVAVGTDGEHVLLSAPSVQWGPNPDPVKSSYVFSRTSSGWQTISARPPGEGEEIAYKEPALVDPDLTQLGFSGVGWDTAEAHQSPDVEMKVGPPGGPYTTIVTGPRSQLSGIHDGEGLVAASADFSKYIIQTEDHTLLRHATGTTRGYDLYEYSGGQLRQVNVSSSGAKISACGAQIARGVAEAEEPGIASGVNSISADGARVFFTDNCTHDLYMRVDGTETVNIGEYDLLAADPEGDELVLEKRSGEAQETREIFLYDTGSETAKLLFSAQGGISMRISEDFGMIYLATGDRLTAEAPPVDSGSDIYLYEVGAEALHFLFQADAAPYEVSRDGRYFYFDTGLVGGVEGVGSRQQVYRYDNAERVVECISCASPYDPEPKLESYFPDENLLRSGNHGTRYPIASNDGDFAFFETSAALVPQDVDGEEENVGLENEDPSRDVYEWRAGGVDGCSHVQGCLALITGGRGGFKNELLGVADEGRDVFFATHEALAWSDDDKAGDIYDARIDGGFPPPPPRPVECEGDACESPLAAPVDTTPASFSFSGAANPAPAATVQPHAKLKPKPRKTKKKTGKRKTKGGKAHRKTGRKARKSDDRRKGR